ncbi:MAG: hypothetical protein GX112_11075, partial [Clostridiaceae bacterium]|nr:hypothetical protein [Clostridiaceae bacterium]
MTSRKNCIKQVSCTATEALEERMHRLHEEIADYTARKDQILTGLNRIDAIAARRQRIQAAMGATDRQWQDYRWQLANRITDAAALMDYLPLNPDEAARVGQVATQYRFAISPYYLSLIDPDDPACQIRRQAVPDCAELDPAGELDPMDEAGST